MATLATGIYGKAVFDGITLNIKDWSWSEGGDDADVTNSNDNGIKKTQVVTHEYTATFGGDWDLDAQPSEYPNITRGETGTLNLYISKEAYFAVAVVVTAFDVTSSATGMLGFKVTAKATAAPTYPGATAYSSSSSSSS